TAAPASGWPPGCRRPARRTCGCPATAPTAASATPEREGQLVVTGADQRRRCGAGDVARLRAVQAQPQPRDVIDARHVLEQPGDGRDVDRLAETPTVAGPAGEGVQVGRQRGPQLLVHL